MPTLESSSNSSLASYGFQDVVPPGAGSVASWTESDDGQEEKWAKWQNWIDDVLIEWGKDPSQFDDDENDPPTKPTISRAITLAKLLQESGLDAPDRVTADPNGIIAFEMIGTNSIASLRVRPEGTIQVLVFRDNRCVVSQTLHDPNHG